MAADCLGVDGPLALHERQTGEMKIRFQVNDGKPAAKAAARRLAVVARKTGLAVVTRGKADAIVALGGDGTILHAVRRFPGVPVLGFNLGGLGYLSSVGERDFEPALAMLAKGAFVISERSMLEVRLPRGRTAAALNDVVIVREMTGHAAEIDLKADGRLAAHYLADGLVIATPTGSTAYSLSAGGPVLMPDSRCFVVTPMNPHALAVRPLVVNDSVVLTATSCRKVNGAAEKTGVYADGLSLCLLGGGESVEIRRSGKTAKLVGLEGYDPYEVLGRKLGWPGGRTR